MNLINITKKELAKEYGIYHKQPICKQPYLTRNGKFLVWEPTTLVKEDDGVLVAIDGWNRRQELT